MSAFLAVNLLTSLLIISVPSSADHKFTYVQLSGCCKEYNAAYAEFDIIGPVLDDNSRN
jgi:hypothetical protein